MSDTHSSHAQPQRIFQALVDQLQEPLLLIDPVSSQLLDANTAASAELGFALHELLALDLASIDKSLQQDVFNRFVSALGNSTVVIHEGLFTRKDGNEFPVEIKFKNVQLDQNYVVASFSNILNRKLMEQTLRDEAQRRRIMIEQTRDGIVTIDQDGQVVEANQGFADMLGYTLEEAQKLHIWDWEKNIPKEVVLEMIRHINGKGDHFETRHVRKDGTSVDVEIINSATHFKDKKLIFCISRNITERKHLEASQKLAAMVYQNIREGMMVMDQDGCIVSINPTFSAITGYWIDEVVGKKPPVLRSGQHSAEFYEDIWAELRNLGHWSGEIIDKRKNGGFYTAWLSIDMVDDGKGQVQSWVGQFSDITDKKEAEQLIWYQANFDSLTKLPNRRMFQNTLDDEIRKSKRSGRALALMFIDLDNFKNVNDSLGHDMGDLLLQQVAERLRECVRESDTIARLGGDEFTVILTNLDDASPIAAVTQKLLANISLPIKLGPHTVSVSASIGITLYPWDANNAEGLLKNADQAMYFSKREGRNCFHFYAAPSH